MLLDAMKYTNSNGDTINLMSEAVRSNPRESKLWSYTKNDTSFGVSQKEFDLTIICAPYNNVKAGTTANDVIKKMSYDVEQQNWGILEVNGWFLDCCFTGVTGIDTDSFGVVSFTAHFVAKNGFRWWKKQVVNLTDSGSRPWTSSSITLDYPFASFKIFFKAKANTSYNFDIRSGSSTVRNFKLSVPSGETKLYYLIDSHYKTIKKATSYSASPSNNWSLSGSISDAISDMSAGFFLNDYNKKNFTIRFNSGALDDNYKSVHIEIYLERGMPEWTTTW